MITFVKQYIGVIMKKSQARLASFQVITVCLFFLLYSLSFSKDTTQLQLHYPIITTNFGGVFIGPVEATVSKYNDKTKNFLSINPVLAEINFSQNDFLRIGVYTNLFMENRAKLDNLGIYELSYEHNFISTPSELLSAKIAHKYFSGYFQDGKVSENVTQLSLVFVHKIWAVGDDGIRVFARTGLGYFYSDKKVIPHLYLGLSIGRGISLSFDVLSFFVKYKQNSFLTNSTTIR
jgi:hypothetical protein